MRQAHIYSLMLSLSFSRLKHELVACYAVFLLLFLSLSLSFSYHLLFYSFSLLCTLLSFILRSFLQLHVIAVFFFWEVHGTLPPALVSPFAARERKKWRSLREKIPML